MPPRTGSFTPTFGWLHYADPGLASLRRPSGGTITPTPLWLDNADR